MAFGSPSGALREYKAGNYGQALKDYEQLLQRKGDDPRLHFNAGAAAYRSRQFEQAAKQFDQALSSPDLKLQELAYYNRGNARYYLGEQNPDPAKRTEAWEKSLKDYDLSRKLNPQDADAKYNYEFVKKRLEELKQQQQQQKQDKQDKSDQQQNQDQQQQQDQQSKQEKDQQQQQSQQDQQRQQPKPEEQQQQQAANQSQGQKDQQQQAQAEGQQKEKSDEKEKEEAAAYAAGQMTPEQAQQLLDSQKGDEQVLTIKQEGKPSDHNRPIKDW